MEGKGVTSDPKQALRAAMLEARRGMDPRLGIRLAAHVLQDAFPSLGQAVAGYWPMGTEMDIRPLLNALHARGHPVLLPVTPPRGQPLSFRRWQPGDVLQPGRFGTSTPTGDSGTPDVLLVPLLAWDGRGHRLGYGGGYYDRTLAALPGRQTIGCAYGAQRVPEVHAAPHDVPLDAVATEEGVTVFGKFGQAAPD